MIDNFLTRVQSQPETISFEETISIIETHYQYHPASFTNGEQVNAEGENAGSCKIFYFAQLHGLSEKQTLHLFGDYYRKDVLENPNNEDHSNIRNFLANGWAGVRFQQPSLIKKPQ